MLSICVAVLALYFLSRRAFALFKNYRIAKEINVPILLSPVGILNPWWTVLQRPLTPLLQRLPFGLGSWVPYSRREWLFTYKFSLYSSGSSNVVAHVSPDALQLYIADPEAVDHLIGRKMNLPKAVAASNQGDIFGPSLTGVNGPQWVLQRKITAAPFNEANCAVVWNEALRQTRQMLDTWAEGQTNGLLLGDDARTLTLNVITRAGFGLSYDFTTISKSNAYSNVSGDRRPSYLECYADMLSNPMFFLGLPNWLKGSAWLPKRFSGFLRNRDELLRYFEEMVAGAKERAKHMLASGQRERGERPTTILDAMLLHSEEVKRGVIGLDSKEIGLDEKLMRRGLKDDEIYGNLFVFGIAGHETTAHTIVYSVLYLSILPQWQDWIRQEINAVLGPEPKSLESLDYYSVFPQLVRARAFMCEVMRFFPQSPNLSRTTGSTPVTLQLSSGQQITVPPHTGIIPNVAGLAMHPIWGPDVAEFRPTRFLHEQTLDEGKEKWEIFSNPPRGITRGAFIPWGDHGRVCPGKKFAQVEFVAVLTTLLWGWKIEVIMEEGEGEREAKERVEKVMLDTVLDVTLWMNRPETVKLRRVKVI